MSDKQKPLVSAGMQATIRRAAERFYAAMLGGLIPERPNVDEPNTCDNGKSLGLGA